ncbi:MAG: hypothetical protein Q8N79_02305 [Candidatus Methanoperedens sp.]|nr:hypothetical protein [Candidatus Methanoperedens sp.]
MIKKTKTIKLEETTTYKSEPTKNSKSETKVEIKVVLPKQTNHNHKELPKCKICNGKGMIHNPIGWHPCPNPKCDGGYIRIS